MIGCVVRRAKAGVSAAFLLLLLPGCRSPTPRHSPSPIPHPTSRPAPLFRDAAAAAGLRFRWGHATREGIDILETIGHGCAFLDASGAGRLDALLVGNDGARLFRNRGDGTFLDVTAQALPAPPARAHFLGCAVADYDGDGRPDILLTGYGSAALTHNEGGSFRDVTRGSGLETRGPSDWTTSAAWADVEGDGRPDLYVCRYVSFGPRSKSLCNYAALDGGQVRMACGPTHYPPERGSLYRNLGEGRFRDVTRAAGMGDEHGNALGCLFCDLNGDGRPDLFVANDEKPADLYLNLGGGRFRNIAIESGTAFGADGALTSGMGLDWGDYDNDGRLDLLVANYAQQPKSLYHNEGNNAFTQATYSSGLGALSLVPLTFGAAFVDVDNDGLLDVVFTNGHVQSQAERVDRSTTYLQSAQLFRNAGGGHFVEADAVAGPDFTRKIVGRGIAVGDYDGDGRQDLLIVDDEGTPLLLHNEAQTPNHWLSLRCQRRPGGSEALGARVTVTAGGRRMVAEARSGGSYLSANAPDAHFGLGAAGTAETVEVRWPGGGVTMVHNVAADHAYRVSPGGIVRDTSRGE